MKKINTLVCIRRISVVQGAVAKVRIYDCPKRRRQRGAFRNPQAEQTGIALCTTMVCVGESKSIVAMLCCCYHTEKVPHP